MSRYRMDKHGIGSNDIRCDECGMWYDQSCSRCEHCGWNGDEQEDKE